MAIPLTRFRRLVGSAWQRLWSLAAALLLGAGGALAQTAAVNPLQGSIGVHDPVMIKSGGTYFVFHTGNGVSMKTSADRITWRDAGRAFASNPAWHTQSVPGAGASLWAPDIHFRDGKYWLYYSVSTFGSRVSAIGLATTAALNPTSGATQWADQGVVVSTNSSSNHNAIDPNVVLDAEGVPWLAYGSFWTGIKLIKLDPSTGKPAAGAQLLSIANHANGGIEAAFIIRKGQYYYQFVSWDKCCEGASSTYNIRVGRSTAVTGPYKDGKGADMLNAGGDLIDKGDDRWKGPGHNAIFVERDTVFLVNHAYDAQDGGRSKLWIRPLYWTAEGWPTLDKGQGTAVGILRPMPPAAGRVVLPAPGFPGGADALGRRIPGPRAFPLPPGPVLPSRR